MRSNLVHHLSSRCSCEADPKLGLPRGFWQREETAGCSSGRSSPAGDWKCSVVGQDARRAVCRR